MRSIGFWAWQAFAVVAVVAFLVLHFIGWSECDARGGDYVRYTFSYQCLEQAK